MSKILLIAFAVVAVVGILAHAPPVSADEYNDQIIDLVDGIDPTAGGDAMAPLCDLSKIIQTTEYQEQATPETKEYVDQQSAEKFNQAMKCIVDQIDPTAAGDAIAPLYNLDTWLHTDMCGYQLTPEMQQYIDQQRVEKFNLTVKCIVDQIDPAACTEALEPLRILAIFLNTDMHGYQLTPEMQQYVDQQRAEKFNQVMKCWVDQIDPTTCTDALEPLHLLAQFLDIEDWYGYQLTPEMRQYIDQQRAEKFNQVMKCWVDQIDPTTCGDGIKPLCDLGLFLGTHMYGYQLTPEMQQYIDQQMAEKFNLVVRCMVDSISPCATDFPQKLSDVLSIVQTGACGLIVSPDTSDYVEQRAEDLSFGWMTDCLHLADQTLGSLFGSDVTITPGVDTVNLNTTTPLGSTTVTISTVNAVGPLPTPYQPVGYFVDITTTIPYDSPLLVDISYWGLNQYGLQDLRLFHYIDGQWEDVTTSVDTVNQVVYGEVDSLSWVVIGGRWVWVDDGRGVPVFPSIYIGIGAAVGAGILAYLLRRRLTRQ